MTSQTTELIKITSKDTAGNFFWWLSEHPEITNIQGFEIERPFASEGDYRPTAFGIKPRHSVHIEFLYTERKILNDWIDRYLTEAE